MPARELPLGSPEQIEARFPKLDASQIAGLATFGQQRQIGSNDRIRNPGFIFQAHEHHSLGRSWTLAGNHASGDSHAAAIRNLRLSKLNLGPLSLVGGSENAG
jgi:hypothetical protein